jgi:Cft2 family RNA processing exonuclease
MPVKKGWKMNDQEPEKGPIKDFVKKKIQANKGKKTTEQSRARTKMARLVKDVAKLLDLMGPHKEAAVQVLVDQLNATKEVYDPGTHGWRTVPDGDLAHKAAVKLLEWLEGKPRELQVSIHGDFEDLASLQSRVAQSPAFKQLEQSSQKTVER